MRSGCWLAELHGVWSDWRGWCGAAAGRQGQERGERRRRRRRRGEPHKLRDSSIMWWLGCSIYAGQWGSGQCFDLTLATTPQQCRFRPDLGAADAVQVGQNLQSKAGDIKDKVRPCLRA